jgi:DNA-binding HxlR family transcriptional regulator
MKGGFGQFCPVAVACEVFAERWTPIILRELLAGSHRFNEIHRFIPLISRTLLAKRLRELERAGVVCSAPAAKGPGREYHLTESGEEFRHLIEGLGTWGQRWTNRVTPENLNAGILIWNIRRRIATEHLPARRVVVHFNFTGAPASYRGMRKFWLLLERSAVDLCVHDPGFEVDLYLDADLAAMTRVWLGDLAFAEAVRLKKIRMSGMPGMIRQFASWLPLSPYAKVPRPGGATAGKIGTDPIYFSR